MKVDLDALEQVAKAAMPGGLLDDHYMGWTQHGWSVRTRSHRYGIYSGLDDMARARADAALVDAADRDTVLALVARIRELEYALTDAAARVSTATDVIEEAGIVDEEDGEVEESREYVATLCTLVEKGTTR